MNKLGGKYYKGLSMPAEKRMAIIKMNENGVPIDVICKKLLITKTGISKIIKRYALYVFFSIF